jgi:predicted permease
MSLWTDLATRVRALVGRARLDAETREELAFHVDMHAASLERRGLPRAEAERIARVSLGSATLVREETHDARGVSAVDDLRRDLVFAARQLRRNPAFSLAAIFTVGLGIGATTAIYSVLNSVLLREPPVGHADRLVMVWETDRRSGTTREPGAWPDYLDFRDRTRSLDGLAAIMGRAASLERAGVDPQRLAVVATTHNYFDLVGVRPRLGRFYSADEDRPGTPTVAVLGERLWSTAFNRDSSVIGQTLRIDERVAQVIGIAPADAEFGLDQIHAHAAYHTQYDDRAPVDIFVPLKASADEYSRDTHPFLLVGRLAPGTTVAVAQSELARIAEDLERTYPGSNTARGVMVEPVSTVVFGASRPVLYLLLGAVILLLLVACVNVANLLLARGAARGRELAVRRAIGASPARIDRQLLVEALTLATLGGAVGLVAATAGLGLIVTLAPAGIPRIDETAIDGRVLIVALVTTVSVGLAFGLAPAIDARGRDVIGALRGTTPNASLSPSARRFGHALVVGEVALAVAVAVGAGLLLRSFRTVLGVDPGFHAERVFKAQYQLPQSRYPADFRTWPNWTAHHRARQTVLDEARSIPGLQAASVAAAHPLDAGFTNSWTVVGREAEGRDWPEISVRIVSRDYFATLRVRLVRGRAFAATDDAAGAPVALINETTAHRFFAESEPIGREIRFWGIARRIIGIVGDERIKGLTTESPPTTYVPLEQNPSNSGVLLVRSTADPEAVMGAIATAVRRTDPQLAVFGVEPLQDTMLASVAERRFALYLVGAFAIATLALAFIGIHGLVSYLAAQRTKEMGIRMALGASRGAVAALVLRGTLALAGLGIAIGLSLALLGSRVLETLLFGVSRFDPATYGAVAVLAIGAALVAGFVPAARATRAAPMLATRE